MVRKEQMVNSARLTCDYLGLRQGDKALTLYATPIHCRKDDGRTVTRGRVRFGHT